MTPQQFRKKSGKLMKQARIAAGIKTTQEVSQGALEQSWVDLVNIAERGHTSLCFDHIVKLARLYNVSVEYFVSLDKPLPEVKKPVTKRQAKAKAFSISLQNELLKMPVLDETGRKLLDKIFGPQRMDKKQP